MPWNKLHSAYVTHSLLANCCIKFLNITQRCQQPDKKYKNETKSFTYLLRLSIGHQSCYIWCRNDGCAVHLVFCAVIEDGVIHTDHDGGGHILHRWYTPPTTSYGAKDKLRRRSPTRYVSAAPIIAVWECSTAPTVVVVAVVLVR